MRVLIASNKPVEMKAALESAGVLVDLIAPERLSRTKQKGYDFVIYDAVQTDEPLRNGNIELDVEKHLVRRNKRVIRVTPLEFRIIKYFLEHSGQIVSKDDLAAGCWRDAAGVSHNIIDVYIKRIRAKFGASTVRTIHSIGYQMDKK